MPMAENAYDVLRGDSPALAAKLNTNHLLCTWLQLVYTHLLNIAADSPEDPRDIELDLSVLRERLMVVTVRYRIKEHVGPTLVRHNKLLGQRNMRIAQLLRVNKSVKDLPARVVEILERWIEEKPYRKACGFANIRFENPRLWKNKTFTVEMVLKTQFDAVVRKKLGWDKEPEQEAEEERRIITP
jgi:hypothetical protein